MTIRKPGLLFRALVLGAQGIFYNLFCKSLSPPLLIVSIRFKGYSLNYNTYSLLISDLTTYLPSLCGSSRGRGRRHIHKSDTRNRSRSFTKMVSSRSFCLFLSVSPLYSHTLPPYVPCALVCSRAAESGTQSENHPTTTPKKPHMSSQTLPSLKFK